MMWDAHAGMGWWMTFASFWFIVFLALAFGVTMLTRSSGGTAKSLSGGALDIAKKRYARGELSREQYEQLRRDLTTDGAGADLRPSAVPGHTPDQNGGLPAAGQSKGPSAPP